MPNKDSLGEMMMNLPPPYRMVHVVERSSNFNLDMHSHAFFQIIYIISGQVTITLPSDQHVVNEGQACIIMPNIMHRLTSEFGYTQIGIDLFDMEDERGIGNLFRERFNQSFSVITLTSMPENFDKINKTIKNLTVLNTLKITNTVETLILKIIEQSFYQVNSNFKERFLAMFSRENAFNLTLEQICKSMGLSKTHLERQINKEFGCSAIEYCNKLKITRACMLLQSTDLPIKTIAWDLSFYDESHFASFFKKRIGIPPGKYRNSARTKHI